MVHTRSAHHHRRTGRGARLRQQSRQACNVCAYPIRSAVAGSTVDRAVARLRPIGGRICPRDPAGRRSRNGSECLSCSPNRRARTTTVDASTGFSQPMCNAGQVRRFRSGKWLPRQCSVSNPTRGASTLPASLLVAPWLLQCWQHTRMCSLLEPWSPVCRSVRRTVLLRHCGEWPKPGPPDPPQPGRNWFVAPHPPAFPGHGRDYPYGMEILIVSLTLPMPGCWPSNGRRCMVWPAPESRSSRPAAAARSGANRSCPPSSYGRCLVSPTYGRPTRQIALPASGGSDRVDARCEQARQRSGTVYNSLPTHRGEHVTGKMTDGPDSVAFGEAKSCLGARKDMLAWPLAPGAVRQRAQNVFPVAAGLC